MKQNDVTNQQRWETVSSHVFCFFCFILKRLPSQIHRVGLSDMAQDTFQDEIHLHGNCLCLGSWIWI